MLMDLDGYDSWERSGVRALASSGTNVDAALDLLARATRAVQQWSPEREPLHLHVTRAFEQASNDTQDEAVARDVELYDLARGAVPAGLAAPEPVRNLPPGCPELATLWAEHDRVVRRYLASRLFANWYVWQGEGLGTAIGALRVQAAVLRMEIARRLAHAHTSREVLLESIRATDHLMVHLVDGGLLARRIDRVRARGR